MDALDFITSEPVQMMNVSEVGQYWLMLCHSWISEKGASLPDDPAYLAHLLRVPEVSKLVLGQFGKVETEWGSRLRNQRLYEEWLAAKDRAGQGREYANKRWHPDGLPVGSQREPNPHTHIHTHIQDQEQHHMSELCSDWDGTVTVGKTKVKVHIPPEHRKVIEEVWNTYISEVGKNPRLYTLTPERRGKAKKRLDECLKKVGGDLAKATELMNIAVQALADSDYHQGKNDKKQPYNDWEIVFRSAEKFEWWLGRAK